MSINLKFLSLTLVTGLFLQFFVFSNVSVGADLMKLSPLYAPKISDVGSLQLAPQPYTPYTRH